MKPPAKNHFQPIFTIMLVWAVLIACSFASQPGSPTPHSSTAPSSAPRQPTHTGVPARLTPSSAPSQPTPTIGPAAFDSGPDPLDRLLRLRSITINLTTLRPDGSSRTIKVEIDDAGSMHTIYNLPALEPTQMPDGVDLKQLPASRELFAIGGQVYQTNPQNPDWVNSPLQEDYTQLLSAELHGADGPALYLDLLPEGSIQAAGKESVGGFAADKYKVNGDVAGQAISGTIWFEPQSDALIQAELTIPAALYGDPGQPPQGTLKITLKAQKAAIPPIKLPEPSAATAQPQSAP